MLISLQLVRLQAEEVCLVEFSNRNIHDSDANKFGMLESWIGGPDTIKDLPKAGWANLLRNPSSKFLPLTDVFCRYQVYFTSCLR